MKKFIKFTMLLLKIIIIVVLVWGILNTILNMNGLMLRAWVKYAFIIILGVLIVVLLSRVVYILGNMEKEEIVTRVSSGLGILISFLGIVGSIIIVTIIIMFSDSEAIVEKNGYRVIVYRESFLQKYANYHEYKNFLVCGSKVIMKGNYNDYYDPAEVIKEQEQ